jgi:hypothetical protein
VDLIRPTAPQSRFYELAINGVSARVFSRILRAMTIQPRRSLRRRRESKGKSLHVETAAKQPRPEPHFASRFSAA